MPFEAAVALAVEIIATTARQGDVENSLRFGLGFVRRLKRAKKSGRFGIQTKGQLIRS